MSSLRRDIVEAISASCADVFSQLSIKTQDYSWLFSQDTGVFSGDILPLKRLGSSWFLSQVNFKTAGLPFLWKSIVFKRFLAHFFSYVERLYLTKLYEQAQRLNRSKWSFNDFKTLFETTFTLDLHAHASELPHWMLNDFFYLVMRVLNSVKQVLECPDDLYLLDKNAQNDVLLKVFRECYDELQNHPHALYLLVILGARANRIDNSDPRANDFLMTFPQEINDFLDSPKELIGLYHSGGLIRLKKACSFLLNAKYVVLELDNAGEACLDLALADYLIRRGATVVIMAKSKPVLNDVTRQDVEALLETECFLHLKEARSNSTLIVAETGSCIPGKYWSGLDLQYQTHFSKSDVVLLKGQGNFHSMPMGTFGDSGFYSYKYSRALIYSGVIKSDLTLQAFKCMPSYRDMAKLDLEYLFSSEPSPHVLSH